MQGTTDVTPVAGQTVTVRGTVVGDYEGASPALRGFYLQDAGDGDPSTSDGIFVFDNGANLVANGDVVEVTVVNTAAVPVSVSSHFHFFEANRALRFNRSLAFGKRLDIPSGTAVRFEPGVEREVVLVPIAGDRVVPGLTLPAPGRL